MAELLRPPRERRWSVSRAPGSVALDGALARALSLHPVLARILGGRGLGTPEMARAFLNPRLSDLMDPFLLSGMESAAGRVIQAVRGGERICVFGDYDVDGLTATAIMLLTLRALGADVFHHIPSRLRDGYGLSPEAIESVGQRGARLIVTVDTGITAVEEIAQAVRLGMDVVVTDHHCAGLELPLAVAIVNPNLEDSWYPHARLSGAGVAFKLAHATLKASGMSAEDGRRVLGSLLELAALGTLADVVSLRGENRVLARWGLERLGQSERAGLRALLELTNCAGKPPSTHIATFVLAPRLNAAGRTREPEISLRLLMEDDPHAAGELARELNVLNEERKGLEKGILQDSLELLKQRGHVETDRVLVAEGEGWHEGVLGIVAARLAERYMRPAIVLSVDGEMARGSARSFYGYNIHDGLTACGGCLLEFGGHAAAAGLRLRRGNVEDFRLAINEHAREALGAELLTPPVEIDTWVDPSEIDFGLLEALRQLEPYGQENAEPVLGLRGAKVVSLPRVVGEKHLRLDLSAGGRRFTGIGFRMSGERDLCEAASDNLDVAFFPRVNEWNGSRTVELELRALRPGCAA